MAHHKQGKKNRKWGRSSRKPSNGGKLSRSAKNRVRRLEQALKKNPTCPNTLRALAEARK